MADTREAPTRGWLPIGIELDVDTPFFGAGAVRWMDIGSDPLADPFLDRSVARLRSASPPAREIDTSLEAFVALAQALPRIVPAGFVFHVSRCGSTLVANALKTIRDVTVLSEPRHAGSLLLPLTVRAGASTLAHWERRRDTLIDSLFRVSAHCRDGGAQPLIVKFPSINTLHIATLRRLWPNTPFLILVRDPIEVVVANMGGGWWRDVQAHPARSIELLGWDGSAMSAPEHCARALHKLHSAAIEAFDARSMVVDYTELSPGKMKQIAEFFGQAITVPAELDRVFRRHSKSVDGLPFQDDSLAKQRAADHLVRAAALQWARKSYDALRRRSTSSPALATAPNGDEGRRDD